LSLAVGKRSLNRGLGKRSSKVSAVEACELAASVPAFGACPHCTRTNDRGTTTARTARQRHRPAPDFGAGGHAPRVAPSDITCPARSDVCDFAPTIHPLPQYPAAIGI